ncbi:hypothetical protein LTSEGIV_2783 [Salmonella enterica subsp. enterica serovar Give str. S5-487]|nr:hypothetical protein LTSEGIV_2783 [Salmonella enterica subsp. enterica serovar Give str. S5-487]
MNADAYKKIMTLSRIACFIALQCALLFIPLFHDSAHCQPVTLRLPANILTQRCWGSTGREKSLPIFPLLKKASAKCLAPIALTSL